MVSNSPDHESPFFSIKRIFSPFEIRKYILAKTFAVAEKEISKFEITQIGL